MAYDELIIRLSDRSCGSRIRLRVCQVLAAKSGTVEKWERIHRSKTSPLKLLEGPQFVERSGLKCQPQQQLSTDLQSDDAGLKEQPNFWHLSEP